jgi:hypothetical protein
MGLSRAAYNNRIRQASSNAHKWTWLIDVIKAKVTSSPSGQISAAHRRMSCPLRRVREVKSKTAGLRPRSALSAKLWNSGNGINGADEELRALLIAQTGTPGLRESAVGLELSMKDVGLIERQKIDGNGNTFLLRGYYSMKKGFGHRLIEMVRKRSRH